MAGSNQLFRSLAEVLNSGQPRNNLVARAGLKPRITGLKIQHTDYLSSKWCDLGIKRFLNTPIFILHIAKGRWFNASTLYYS